MSEPRIRPATPADAQSIARVHVQAWCESYRGIVPDEAIEALSVEHNAGMWAAILDQQDASLVHVVEVGKDIVGFGTAGSARSEALGTTGEIAAIYLLDDVKRPGIGRMLLAGLMR